MDDDPVELTVKEIYQTHLDMTRLIYFDYMALCKDGDFDSFCKIHLEHVRIMLFLLHDRYADHVEGAKKAVMESFSKQGDDLDA